MKGFVLLLFCLIPFLNLKAQYIEWNDVSDQYDFPDGLKLFHGTISGNPTFFAYYYEVNLNYPDISVRPYISPTTVQVNTFAGDAGAYGAINAGFFSGTSSVSSVIYPGEVPARNLISVSRDSKTYPVIRSIFAVHFDRSLATEWVYHHTYSRDDIYLYDNPMPYACDDPTPLPVPLKQNGRLYEDIAYGIGGGPVLIKDGQINISYCEEIFWGSGVYLTDYRPRSAVGYTQDKKVIMFVTNNMKIAEMAEALHLLGCYEAMNLDGGGSTAMSVGDQALYTQNRAVPTILAVVHTDSLKIPKQPVFEKFIDTNDEGVTSAGSWFNSANDGYWETPSRLHALGTDEQFYQFPLNLPGPGEYEIYGWWTAHPNRSADAPFYVTHGDETTLVRMNQSTGGSLWNMVGKFSFTGTPGENVKITAAGTTNQFVVADGIRVVTYDQILAPAHIISVEPVGDVSVPYGTSREDALALLSPQTVISDSKSNTHPVDLLWDLPGYNPELAGEYQAIGSFELPQGVVQSDPPVDTEVYAMITVLADDTRTGSVEVSAVNIFPNPSMGTFTVEGWSDAGSLIQIFAYDGRLIESFRVSGVFSREVTLGDHSKGIYLLRLTGNQKTEVWKIAVQ